MSLPRLATSPTSLRLLTLLMVKMGDNLEGISELRSCMWKLRSKFLDINKLTVRSSVGCRYDPDPQKLERVGTAPAGGSLDVTHITEGFLNPGLRYASPTSYLLVLILRCQWMNKASTPAASTLSIPLGIPLVNHLSPIGKRGRDWASLSMCFSARRTAAAPPRATLAHPWIPQLMPKQGKLLPSLSVPFFFFLLRITSNPGTFLANWPDHNRQLSKPCCSRTHSPTSS